jgi:hypothetical protein
VSDKNDDFVSFENAMRELRLRSEELRKLVSQGDIRAKKEGASMKFKRADLEALAERLTGDAGATQPVDALEDDTGMVTEQISDDDTLLAEEATAPISKPVRPAPRASKAPVVAAAAAPAPEPGWVTAISIVSFLVLVWGLVVHYAISQDANPVDNMFTTAWSNK